MGLARQGMTYRVVFGLQAVFPREGTALYMPFRFLRYALAGLCGRRSSIPACGTTLAAAIALWCCIWDAGSTVRVLRVGFEKGQWYDLDYPDVIELRRRFYDETGSYHMVPASAGFCFPGMGIP